jgi:triosephosphate isomerase (TIM)
MRKKIIAGNWKMNKTINEALDIVKNIKQSEAVDIVIAPPYTCLDKVSNLLVDSKIILAAQNMHQKVSGAFTGEISPLMLKDVGCKAVILGHSERREYFHESNSIINEKTKTALAEQLKVILCIGETLEQRKSEKTNDILKEQLEGCLLDVEDLNDVVIAYEPVWAIGTGEVASPQQAQDAHLFIRNTIKKMYNDEVADSIRILYGGSMKSDNADGLLNQPDIDGGLIGGASLIAEEFNKIINIAEKTE